MKYETMRFYYKNNERLLIIDLFNMHYERGVELHYRISRNYKFKWNLLRAKIILMQHSRELHDIQYYDDLISQYMEKEG